jgi:hypothetical protein
MPHSHRVLSWPIVVLLPNVRTLARALQQADGWERRAKAAGGEAISATWRTNVLIFSYMAAILRAFGPEVPALNGNTQSEPPKFSG